MIKLDHSRIEGIFSFYRDEFKPTHAKIVIRHHQLLDQETAITLPVEMNSYRSLRIEAFYSYGNIADSKFKPMKELPLIQVVCMMNEVTDDPVYWTDVDRQKAAATKNLRGGGIIPHPERPHESVSCPQAREDDFRECDLDAYFAFFDPRLYGSVI